MAEKTIMVQKLRIACENRFGGVQETWETERPNKKTGSEFFWKENYYIKLYPLLFVKEAIQAF